jgi:hypothetical protein
MFWLFLGIALIMLAIALLTGFQITRSMAGETQAPGFVTGMVSRSDANGNEFFYPIVAFTLPDGSRKIVQTGVGSWPPAYAVDDAVTVVFDPERPSTARIATPAGALAQWIWTLVTGILAVAFFLAAWLAWWVAGSAT